MKFILHVGRGKTGTTALQTFLSRHYSKPKDGLLYPRIWGANHNILTKDVAPKAHTARPYRTDSKDTFLTGRYFDELYGEISKYSDVEIVILSGETLLRHAREVVNKLLADIPGCEVDVIVYFRLPASNHVASSYQQAIKASARLPNLENFISIAKSNTKFARDFLELEKENERIRIHLGIYNKAILQGRGLAWEFGRKLNLTAFDRIDEFQGASDQRNSSLSAEGTLLMRAFREVVIGEKKDNTFDENSTRFLKMLLHTESENWSASNLTKLALTPQVSEIVDAASTDFLDLCLTCEKFNSKEKEFIQSIRKSLHNSESFGLEKSEPPKKFEDFFEVDAHSLSVLAMLVLERVRASGATFPK